MVLAGRCYERESVPYKALDSLVDALSRLLRNGFPPTKRERCCLASSTRWPSSFRSCALFTSACRTASRCHGTCRSFVDARPRRCGTCWLGSGDTHALVAVIDDLQWGDVDSAMLLADVMRPPDGPVCFLIAVYRDVEVQTSPFLRSFLTDDITRSQSFLRLRVDPLSGEESQELVAALASSVTAALDLSVIAAESGGSPFFIRELVRFAETGLSVSPDASVSGQAADSEAREATLVHVMRIRIARLPRLARLLLQVIAVNGRPMPQQVLRSAAGEPATDAPLALLRSEHLLRVREDRITALNSSPIMTASGRLSSRRSRPESCANATSDWLRRGRARRMRTPSSSRHITSERVTLSVRLTIRASLPPRRNVPSRSIEPLGCTAARWNFLRRPRANVHR